MVKKIGVKKMTYNRSYVETVGMAYRSFPERHNKYLKINALGIPMYVMSNDFSVTPCLINDGYWEAWISTWVLNNVNKNTTFVDIGANTGYYSFISSKKGARVVAFEPNDDYSIMMRDSAQLNGLMVHILPYAVSDKMGEAELVIPENLQGSASIVMNNLDEYNPTKKMVSTMPLDTFYNSLSQFSENTEIIIKVDAEGAEELIWNGAESVRIDLKPVWLLEYTPGAYSRDFLDKLESYGQLQWINHEGREEPITKNEILAHADWVMLLIRPKE